MGKLLTSFQRKNIPLKMLSLWHSRALSAASRLMQALTRLRRYQQQKAALCFKTMKHRAASTC